MPRSRTWSAFLILVVLLFPSPALAFDPEPPVAELAALMTERHGHIRPTAWGETLAGVVTRLPPASGQSETSPRRLALTLDACDGGTDRRILALLRRHRVPATIFVTNRWLHNNRAVAADLAADPLFVLACHGARHRPASVSGRTAFGIRGTRNVAALVEEVESNARALQAVTGLRPSWYRSGTAHYDDVALKVIGDLGLSVAGYTVSADAGASLGGPEVARKLMGAPDRAILLCHLNHPESGTFDGLASALPRLLKGGARFEHLDNP